MVSMRFLQNELGTLNPAGLIRVYNSHVIVLKCVSSGDYSMRRLTAPGGVPLTVISQSTVQPAPYTLFQCYGCYGQVEVVRAVKIIPVYYC